MLAAGATQALRLFSNPLVKILFALGGSKNSIVTSCGKNSKQEELKKLEKVMGVIRIERILMVSFLAFLVATLSCERKVIEEIQKSHIQANVPQDTEFLKYLKRDVSQYMSSYYNQNGIILLEFLREGATQSGVAYPKFYLWVTIRDSVNQDEIGQGAIRVAAIGKERFNVTDYLKKDVIRVSPDSIYMVFPRPVCDRIIEKIK